MIGAGLVNVCNLRVGDLDRSIQDEAAGSIEGKYFPFTCHDGHLAYVSLDSGGKTMGTQPLDWLLQAKAGPCVC